ncbi:DUF6252 family protein [Hymenobacter weizhouensis]|uniref:DUF6252 family protein n=1 Tax=Hymenobacter sp. YIM 151500-1 TaxID=2987689 RepID=UPI002225F3E9|nr:DUF6252 family protein [Hymenobacter sp. YIM 151500-1]UYZ63052.1 DUF6252 family protein [Hymenobacter sp. YIM 151500-1]
MKLPLGFAVALLCTVVACQKKHVTPLPSGKNTFSCRIDGKTLTPQLPPIILTTRTALKARRVNRAGGFFIEAKDSFNELDIYSTPTQGVGTYSLGYSLNTNPYSYPLNNYGVYRSYRPITPNDDPYNLPDPVQYYTDATHTGTVRVTRFDTVARVAGGTFEYTAKDKATGKLVRITNGQFDVLF